MRRVAMRRVAMEDQLSVRITWDVLVSSLHFGRRGCILADGWAAEDSALHRGDQRESDRGSEHGPRPRRAKWNCRRRTRSTIVLLECGSASTFVPAERIPVKRHRGEPGHTRDTRTHKGTRTAQTNPYLRVTLRVSRQATAPEQGCWCVLCLRPLCPSGAPFWFPQAPLRPVSL